MNKDNAAAQAETLRTWADQWSRDETSGATEVSFLLKRVASKIEGVAFGMPMAPDEKPLPFAPVIQTVEGDLTDDRVAANG